MGVLKVIELVYTSEYKLEYIRYSTPYKCIRSNSISIDTCYV